MSNKEKIELLKQYKKYLLQLRIYQNIILNEQKQEDSIDKPKVLVLKKKFNGKDMVVS